MERFARDVDGAQRPAPAPDGGAYGGAGLASAREPPGGAPGAPSPAAGPGRQQACAHGRGRHRHSSRGCFNVFICCVSRHSLAAQHLCLVFGIRPYGSDVEREALARALIAASKQARRRRWRTCWWPRTRPCAASTSRCRRASRCWSATTAPHARHASPACVQAALVRGILMQSMLSLVICQLHFGPTAGLAALHKGLTVLPCKTYIQGWLGLARWSCSALWPDE